MGSDHLGYKQAPPQAHAQGIRMQKQDGMQTAIEWMQILNKYSWYNRCRKQNRSPLLLARTTCRICH